MIGAPGRITAEVNSSLTYRSLSLIQWRSIIFLKDEGIVADNDPPGEAFGLLGQEF